MRYLFLIISIFIALPVFSATELSVNNAGFVQSSIWYSKDPFYAGDKVRIYTVIFNGSTYDLAGSVEFLDNGTSLGKTTFSLSGNGRAQDLWIDWKASAGNHTITARLVNVIADGPNGKQAVSFPSVETGKSDRFVDIDPAIKEAQAKIEAQKITAVRVDQLGKVEEVAQSVVDSIPTPIKESIVSAVSIVEQFRANEGNQLGVIREQKSREIDEINAHVKTINTTPVNVDSTKKEKTVLDVASNVTEKPFAYVMLAAIGALQFVFEWKILFYGIIFYTIYRVMKWGIYKLRNR